MCTPSMVVRGMNSDGASVYPKSPSPYYNIHRKSVVKLALNQLLSAYFTDKHTLNLAGSVLELVLQSANSGADMCTNSY